MRTINSLSRFSVYLLLVTVVSVFIPMALYGQEATGPSFDLRVNTDYHLNQDGRPTPSYDFLVPLYSDNDSLIFFNPRYHIDDETNLNRAEEWNLGLGYRRMVFGDRAILGANVYYDWRRSMTGNQFEQLGAGLELMTEDVTARVNGYLSLTEPQEIERWREYYFAETSLNYVDYARYEVPMSGVDGEVGFRVPYLSDYLETWVYGGGYYFTAAEVEDIGGVKGRVEVRPTDYLRFDFEARDDNVRGTDYYGEVRVDVPFSIENLVAGKNPFEGLKEKVQEKEYVALADRMYDNVERDPDVITNLSGDKVVNNSVWKNLVYVRNNYVGRENGTYSRPYNTIPEGLAVMSPLKVLFVMAGNTTTGYPGFTVSGTKANGITVWGQGYSIPGVGLPHGLAANWPRVNGTVTVNARNVEIMGLNFRGPTGLVLYGANENIHHNLFNDTDKGVEISCTRAPYTSIIQNNTFLVSSSTGTAYGIYGASTGRDLGSAASPLLITGNTFTISSSASNGSAYGIYLDSNTTTVGGNLFANISGNSFTVSADVMNGYGIRTDVDKNIGSYTNPVIISENTVNSSSGATITFGLYLQNIQTGNIFADVTSNSITTTSPGSNSFGIFVTSATGNIGYDGLHVNPVTVSGNDLNIDSGLTSYGIRLAANGSLFADIIANDMSDGVTGHGDTYGIALSTSTGSIGSTSYPITVAENILSVSNHDIASSDGYGINIDSGSDLFGNIGSNTISVNAQDESWGIRLRATDDIGNDDATVTEKPAVLSGNTVSVLSNNSKTNGIYVASDSKTLIEIAENNITVQSLGTDNADDVWGIHFWAMNAGLGSTTHPAILYKNTINATTSRGEVGGILAVCGSTHFAEIAENMITVSGPSWRNALGIYLEAYSGGFGAATFPVRIQKNSIGISASGNSYGVLLWDANNPSYVVISENDMSRRIVGNLDSYGIALISGDTYGDQSHPVIIRDNILDVRSNSDSASGVYIKSNYGLFADIANNRMSGGDNEIWGNDYAYGVYLESVNTGVGNETLPSNVSANLLKVTANNNNVFGTSVIAPQNIFARIVGNDMTGDERIWGRYLAYGVYMKSNSGNIGYTGTTVKPALVAENLINVFSEQDSAYGVYSWANNALFVDAAANSITVRNNGYDGTDMPFGIYFESVSGNIGSYTNPVSINNNTMDVRSNSGGGYANAYGVYLNSSMNIFSTIATNDITVAVPSVALWTYGIYLYTPSGSIGTDGTNIRPVTIVNNIIDSDSAQSTSFGIHCWALNSLFADVINNDMSKGITGYNTSYGINLYSSSGSIGSAIDPVNIIGNKMFLETYEWMLASAYGIGCLADDYVFATIRDNSTTGIGIRAQDLAYGISLEARNNDLGSPTRPIDVSHNLFEVEAVGSNSAYGLCIKSGGDIYAQGGIIGNALSVKSAGSNAYGIYVDGKDDFLCSIENNDLSGTPFVHTYGIQGNNNAYGIYLTNTGSAKKIGAEYTPVGILNNSIDVKANNDEAAGIYLTTGDRVFADINGNDMYTGNNDIWGKDNAYGIYVRSTGGTIGSIHDPMEANKNLIEVWADTQNCFGMNITANQSLLAEISSNSISPLQGYNTVYGIYLRAENAYMGLDGSWSYVPDPVKIYDNSITVSSQSNNAYALGLRSYQELFASIINNTLNAGGYTGHAYGAWIRSDNLTIGNNTSPYPIPTVFSDNDGAVNSSMNNEYMLYLETPYTTGVNYLDLIICGANTITTSGGWDGNYYSNKVYEPFSGPAWGAIGGGGNVIYTENYPN